MGIFRYSSLWTLGLSAALASAQSVSLRPSLEEEVIDTKIGGRRVFSMGFYADSGVPFNHRYKLSSSTGNGTFAYQVPLGVGFDFALGLSSRWELGASAGYQKFESREIGGTTDTTKNYVIGSTTSFPLRVLLRYRFPEKVVAPEIEIAGGLNIQKTSIRSTVNNATLGESSRMAPYGHVGAGIAYAWGNDLTIHFIGGYSALLNGSTSYDAGATYTVTTNSLVHGLFTKGMVRVQF